MSAPAPTGKIEKRTRRQKVDSDDDEETVAVPTVPQMAAAGGEEADNATTTALRPPARAKPKAPSARAAAATSVESSAATAAAATSAAEERHEDPNAPAIDPATLLTVDYDAMTYDEFLNILAGVTKDEVWNSLHGTAEEEQEEGEEDAPSATLSSSNQRPEKFVDGTGGYTYAFLLHRICETLKLNNELSATTERNKIPMPVIEKLGKKKTVMVNFGAICDAIGRSMEDVKEYLEKELSVQGNIDSNNSLIMKIHAVKPNQFDRVLFQYLDEYVKCNSCHKINTTLTKEGRITVLKCNLCKASRTVQAMGSVTYNAQVGKRSKARLQALTL